jgi:hypothetical protein
MYVSRHGWFYNVTGRTGALQSRTPTGQRTPQIDLVPARTVRTVRAMEVFVAASPACTVSRARHDGADGRVRPLLSRRSVQTGDGDQPITILWLVCLAMPFSVLCC